MHRFIKAFIICICSTAVVVSLGLVAMNVLENRSDAKIDRLLAKLPEGMPFAEVREILGEPYLTFKSQDDVMEWGTIKDGKITVECNLYLYLRLDLFPHKFILVYEDKKNLTVRFVTIKGT